MIIVLAAACIALFVLPENDSADTVSPAATVERPMAERQRRESPERELAVDLSAERTIPAAPPRGVDLHALREKLADNIYWQLDAPTTDPEELRLRAEEKKSWESLRGRIVSNTASEEEIDRYYDHQKRVSEDYIAFSTAVLEEYGDQLSEPEVGAHELSLKMHAMRLGELPRHREEARARKLIQDQKREEWRRQQAQ